MTTVSASRTFLDALADAIEDASSHNRHDQVPPAAVLWTDEARQWEDLLPQLKDRLPIFILGEYAEVEHTGPAYWLRCIIARTISHPGLAAEAVPILYLPGWSWQDMRILEKCPVELRPLAELQYRGVLWSQENGHDWTIDAFLRSRDGGLGIEVEADHETREALQRSLIKLALEPIDAIRGAAPLRASYLDGLIHPNNVKNVLRWLDDPSGYRGESSVQEWEAFAALCEGYYDFHPDRDSPVTVAEKLGHQQGYWGRVWRRFAESPALYAAVPDRLREAMPETTLPLLDHLESWPQNNETEETSLRNAVLSLSDLDADAARRRILELEDGHGVRRTWVWASLGSAPLAEAIGHIAKMVQATERMAWGTSISEIMQQYADYGWVADLAVIDALGSVEKLDDVKAVRSALRTVYRPWLEGIAVAFQNAMDDAEPVGYQVKSSPEVADGTCLLFVDGLRFDLAHRLGKMLESEGIEVEVEPRLTALPSVTATAKPAVCPAAPELIGGEGFETVVEATGTKVTAQVLRRLVGDAGFQVLGSEELGDVAGRAWLESGSIDEYGHTYGWRIAHHAAGELRRLAERIAGLLEHGWKKVVVITDHGWLLMPGDLPKVELPEHLTEIRKGRCARLKEGSQTDQLVLSWHWNREVRIAVAPGIHCYEAGKEYEHGGLSPQECVVPILTATGRVSGVRVSISDVRWRRLRCDIAIEGSVTGARGDIRTKGDASTTLTGGGKPIGADGKVSLLVKDADREDQAALVVIIGPDGAVLTQNHTVVGGP